MAGSKIKINKDDVLNAIEKIDKDGIPSNRKSKKYELVIENGKSYPVKLVVDKAIESAGGTNTISNSLEANKILRNLGFNIDSNDVFTLEISSVGFNSDDSRFDENDIGLGDYYEPVDVYFQNSNGAITRRIYSKGEHKITNQTLPKLVIQIFEREIKGLSASEKSKFPICRYNPNSQVICGIYSSENDYKEYRKSIEYLKYRCSDNSEIVIYSWNIFSTLLFVKECLTRFGGNGDKLYLKYREKGSSSPKYAEEIIDDNGDQNEDQIQQNENNNYYSELLLKSRNIIFHGAPGTGKTFLAKEIAANIVSDGLSQGYDSLSDKQKECIGFVQFHPNYDYTDFVEGIRPILDSEGSMNFELRDGIFKKFVEKARKNFVDSSASSAALTKSKMIDALVKMYIENLNFNDIHTIMRGGKYHITDVDEMFIYINVPSNKYPDLKLSLKEIKSLLIQNKTFKNPNEVKEFLHGGYFKQTDSYYYAIYEEIRKWIENKKQEVVNIEVAREKEQKYVFIIDEINRGEISKIFGELFFSIDPGYRGEAGAVYTQYSNLHLNPEEKFYIPENVYIIGTMNDIDRSVDSFDFAMRRRFRFIELKAEECQDMLSCIRNETIYEEVIKRMNSLNEAIVKVEGLNESYQIGPAYFLSIEKNGINFDDLWTDYLEPLLYEYVRGLYNENEIMEEFAKAYGYSKG